MLRKFVFAFALLFVAGGLFAAEYKGKIKSVDSEKNTITITVEDKDVTLNVDKEVKALGGKDGKTELKGGLKSKDLKAGTAVIITTEGEKEKEVVKEIKIGSGKNNK